MTNSTKPIEYDADSRHAWTAALPHEQIDAPMRTTSSESILVTYGTNLEFLVTTARSKMEGSGAGKAGCISATCTQAEVQIQIEKTLVDML